MSIKSTSDLRKMLIDTINDVKSGKVEPTVAREIVRLSNAILESARLDLDVLKYNTTGDKLGEAGKNVLQLIAG